MQKIWFFLLLGGLFTACRQSNDQGENYPVMEVNYPETEKGDVADVYHGEEVPDPYRWLEVDTASEVKPGSRPRTR